MAVLMTLPALIALYRIDRDLETLKQSLDTVQKSQRAQQQKIAQQTAALETLETANRKLQAEVGGKELEIKTRQEHIEKMRTSLNTTKTNKEYSAILVQISADKAEVSKFETAVLEQMSQVEANGKTLATMREQLATEQAVLAKIQSEQGGRVSNLQGQIDALTARRREGTVPPDALQQYDRVSRKYPGDAMATLDFEEDDLDAITCGGCYMGLNTEDLNALRSRNEIRRCNSCGRILYLQEMMPQEQSAAH